MTLKAIGSREAVYEFKKYYFSDSFLCIMICISYAQEAAAATYLSGLKSQNPKTHSDDQMRIRLFRVHHRTQGPVDVKLTIEACLDHYGHDNHKGKLHFPKDVLLKVFLMHG